jgi:hypothetical protein
MVFASLREASIRRRSPSVGLALAAFAMAALPALWATGAQAQATRTWVSGVGDDVNPCSRTAPCKTFAGAISKTAAGGEINCLDSGGFGAVTINKSMTILCEGVVGGVVVAGTNAIVFNGGANDYLFLKGLDIEGAGTGLAGIKMNSGARLHVEDCVIRNFNNAAGFGIQIASSTNAKFVVLRTTLFRNGSGATGAGLQIQPTSGATVFGLLDKVNVDGNVFGVAVDTGGSAGINITIRDSGISGNNTDGVIAVGPTGAGVMIERSSIVNNGLNGLRALGSGVIRVGSSTLTGNVTSVNGTVQSYGNNQINGNGTDTVPAAVPGGLR